MKNHYFVTCAAMALLSGAGAAWAATPGAAPSGADAAPVSTVQTSASDAASVQTAPFQTAPVSAAEAAPVPAMSETAPGVEEIVVTAQRRNESVEKVPFTVQAFTGETLSQLNVTTLDDLLKYTPNVTYGNNGPGQGNIFIRGLSAGFAGNQSSATVGNFPNVAIYLDDQSFQFPSRNVDIYVADMARVEVLEGPQGTLFGGGAEAGAVRYITNKPNPSKYEANAEGSFGGTSGGAENSSVNATLNVPIIQDKLAIRAVVYDERRGGYIDNVSSNFTRSNQDNGNYYFGIAPTNGTCPNHLPSSGSNGCTPPGTPSINNASVPQKDQNPTTYQGARISALYDINKDWNVLIQQSFQDLDAEGLYAEYPTGSNFQPLQALQVTSFTPSYDKDHFENTSWTLNGKVGPLRAIYTGGYLDRHISQQMEYSNYSRTGGGIYYQCSGGGAGSSLLGAGRGQPITCYSPQGYWQDTVHNTHLTQEARISTPDDWRFRAIAGVYYENFKIYDVQNFNYKTIPACNASNLAIAQAGGPICLADVTTAPGSTANDPGVRGDSTAFGEDTQRGYAQTAAFASIDFDIIPNVLTITGGTRYFNYREFEVGSQYGTTAGCVDVPNGDCTSGLININSHDDKVGYHGFKSRANITYHLTPRTLFYYTFSQGFRPGGFNRSAGLVATGPDGVSQYNKPNGYAPDSLTNNEIGVKTELFDRRLQINLSAYDMDWDNVQFGFFNPTELGNTTFGTNGPSYNIKGVEAQFVGRVYEGVTLQGSATYDDDTQSNSPSLIDNNPASINFGKPITQILEKGVGIVPFTNPFGTIGSTPAFSPKFQANLRARYDRQVGEYKAYGMLGGSYTGSMYNEPATYLSGTGVTIPSTTVLRYLQAAYVTEDAQLGVSKDNWHAQLFVNNLLDSHASTFTSSAQFIKSEVPIRPRTFGLTIGASF